MFRTTTRKLLALAALTLGVSSTAIAGPHGHAYGHARAGFVAPRPAPPPVPVVVRPRAPATQAVWIPGQWQYVGYAWTWTPGYWAMPQPVPVRRTVVQPVRPVIANVPCPNNRRAARPVQRVSYRGAVRR